MAAAGLGAVSVCTRLKPLILIPEFWFAWSQFRPGTRLFTVQSAS